MIGAVYQIIEYRGSMRCPTKQTLGPGSADLQVERERVSERSQDLPGGLQRPGLGSPIQTRRLADGLGDLFETPGRLGR
jgi:hypothetical protein